MVLMWAEKRVLSTLMNRHPPTHTHERLHESTHTQSQLRKAASRLQDGPDHQLVRRAFPDRFSHRADHLILPNYFTNEVEIE